GQRGQQAAGDQVDVVRRTVLRAQRILGVLAVVHHPGDLVHLLVQATAQGHVDLLQAAADRQYRQAHGDRTRGQGQGVGVAGGVVQVALPAGLVAVMVRLDIADRAGEQQAVQAGKPGVRIRGRLQRGHQDRDGIGAVDHRAHVLLAGGEEGVRTDQFAVGRQSDQRRQGHASSVRWRSGNLPRPFYFYNTTPLPTRQAAPRRAMALSILDDNTAVTLVWTRRATAMTPPSTSALPAGDLATLQALGSAPDAHVDLLLPDANGVLRGKRVPASALEKVYANGVCLPMSLVAADILGNTVEETGLGYDIGDEDRICRPVPGSLRPVPWSPRPALQLLLQMEDGEGGWFEAHPRRVLQRVLDRFAAAGLAPVLAVELEFYLFDRLADADGRPQPTINSATGRRND